MAHIPRTRFAGEIVAEYLPPRSPSSEVVILCPGMPTSWNKSDVLQYFSKRNYWTFLPRYRGTWESEGEFLGQSTEHDIFDMIEQIPRGFHDLWNQRKLKVSKPRISIVGSSFGGAVALLSARDKRVQRVVAAAPVTDWRIPSPAEPWPHFTRFVRQAFGDAYRFRQSSWEKLEYGKILNPIQFAAELAEVADKIQIIQSKGDEVIPLEATRVFAEQVGCKLYISNTPEHLGLSDMITATYSRRMLSWLRS